MVYPTLPAGCGAVMSGAVYDALYNVPNGCGQPMFHCCPCQ